MASNAVPALDCAIDICPLCTATVRDDNYVLIGGGEVAHVECWEEYFDDREYSVSVSF